MNLRTVVLVVIILVLHAPGDNSWNRRRRRHSRKPPPCHQRPCQVSEWSAWSGCSDGCVQTRRRYKTMSESCGGGCHFRLYEKRACTDHENCQPSCQKRPCLVSEWSPWSVCSGGCSQKRHRYKTLSESCGGVCNFHLYEERACHGNCQKDKPRQDKDKGMTTFVKIIIGLISTAVLIVIPVLLKVYCTKPKQSVGTQPGSAREAHCCKCNKCNPRCSPVTYITYHVHGNVTFTSNNAWLSTNRRQQQPQQLEFTRLQTFKCPTCSRLDVPLAPEPVEEK